MFNKYGKRINGEITDQAERLCDRLMQGQSVPQSQSPDLDAAVDWWQAYVTVRLYHASSDTSAASCTDKNIYIYIYIYVYVCHIFILATTNIPLARKSTTLI